MRQPGQQCFRGHPQVTVGVDTVDWFPEELYCSGFSEAPTGLYEEHRISLQDIDGDHSFSQPPLEVVEIGLYVADERRWLEEHGYDGHVPLESQLSVVGWCGKDAYID
jgi:hypothetical protein